MCCHVTSPLALVPMLRCTQSSSGTGAGEERTRAVCTSGAVPGGGDGGEGGEVGGGRGEGERLGLS